MTDTNSPERTTLYRLYDANGQLLYVGVTGNPRKRFGDHRRNKDWWGDVSTRSLEWFDTEAQALEMEIRAITTEAPKYNLRSTDAFKAQQSATARAVSPEKRRARGVGVAARAVYVRTLRELRAQGVPEAEAQQRAAAARQRYKEDSGLFGNSA